MSEEMYFIKEFRELLVCQHATNHLPPHSALPHFRESVEELKGVKNKNNILAQWAQLFGWIEKL